MKNGMGQEREREGPDGSPSMVFDPEAIPRGASWYCLHTLSRREKRVAADCSGRSIPYFLPLRKSIRRYGGRSYIFHVPLFSGYVFCAATPDERHWLLTTKNLARVIDVPDQQSLILDLRQVALALEREAPLEPYQCLKRGVRVRIEEGPFEGIEGIVSERRKKFRVVLNVGLIHQAVALEIDAAKVKPI